MSDCTGPHDRCDRCAGKPECRVLCFECWTEYVPDPRERAASGRADGDALWREYEEAREEFREAHFSAGRQYAVGPLLRAQDERCNAAYARLDAAVRALAAAPPLPPTPSTGNGAAQRDACMACDDPAEWGMHLGPLDGGIDLRLCGYHRDQLRSVAGRAAVPREREPCTCGEWRGDDPDCPQHGAIPVP